MSFSLNEMEATAKRAARGAGYSWGLAEEASKAARWLCVHGLNGSEELIQVLQRGFADQSGHHRPHEIQGNWQSEGDMCPIAVGALLSDCAQHLSDRSIEMQNVAVPSVLLPFAANVAKITRQTVCVDVDGTIARTDGVCLEMQGDLPKIARRVSVSLSSDTVTTTIPQTRSHPDQASWDALNQFAHRTYAPATEESRKLGAGAGLSDND
ncbi:DUF3726 domain-containing protein [Gelidibacter sp. F2691]|nr:DUF3726 domain-containing protein [Gelidibacter sp. F2691]